MAANPKPQGPTASDLDKALRQWRKKLHQVNVGAIFTFIIMAVIAVWVLSGIFVVGPQEKAVVLRFGQYVNTEEAGIHWIAPFIENRDILNVEQIQTYSYRTQILTKDDAMVLANVNVQYRIDNARNYLFNVANTEQTLQQATASALRQTLSNMSSNDLFITQVQTLDASVKQTLSNILAPYHMGVIILDVNMLPVRSPLSTDNVDEGVKQAQAYQQQVIAKAQAQVAPFLAALAQYEKAPQVTRDQLYIDAMQNALTNASTILFATTDLHPQFYLPLDLFTSSSATIPWRMNDGAVNTNNNTFAYPVRPPARPASRPTRPENNNEKR